MPKRIQQVSVLFHLFKEHISFLTTTVNQTADVEGHDVRAKIAILAKLAFGKTTSPSQIPCLGITNISSVDFEYAKLLGCTIKLIGTAKRLSQFGEHDGALSVYVTPKVNYFFSVFFRKYYSILFIACTTDSPIGVGARFW